MLPETHLKICGITNTEDVRLVNETDAHYSGFLIDVEFSERSLTLNQAFELTRESLQRVVILLCNPSITAAKTVADTIDPFALQLLGQESLEFIAEIKSLVSCQIWKTVHLPTLEGQASPQQYARAGADALIVDSVDSSEGFLRLGGTGKIADWDAAAKIVESVSVPVFLAGGITPDNVGNAIPQVNPRGIDLCSGVECSRGKKDPQKLFNLVKNFKSAVTKSALDA